MILIQNQNINLKVISSYSLVNQSGCVTVPGVDDKKDFQDTLQTMEIIGTTAEERE